MTANTCLLTISIAAYNVSEYIEDCLGSCLSCPDDRFELIVINDGSTDDTVDIVRRIARLHPEHVTVINKLNGGYGSTINAGLRVAHGKYFHHLDGDDWFDQTGLANLLQLLSSTDVDVVVNPYTVVYEDGREDVVIDDAEALAGYYDADSNTDLMTPLSAHSITYRTELLRSSRFRMTEHCFYTDTEYAVLPWINVGNFYVAHFPVYRYRLGREGQSVSSAGLSKHFEDVVTVCNSLFEKTGPIISNQEHGHNEIYLSRCLVRYAVVAYDYLLRANPSLAVYRCLEQLDSCIQAYPEIMKDAEKKSRVIRLLRLTRLRGYRLFSAVQRHRS